MFFKLRATFWKVDFFLNTIIEKKHKIGMQCKRIPQKLKTQKKLKDDMSGELKGK